MTRIITIVVWALLSGLGVVHHWRRLNKAKRIRSAIVRTGINHGAEILSRGRVRSERVRGIANALALVAILIALVDPDIPEICRRSTRAGIVVAVALLLMLGLMQYASVLDGRDDEELRREELGGGEL
jgi:hypothetical protein